MEAVKTKRFFLFFSIFHFFSHHCRCINSIADTTTAVHFSWTKTKTCTSETRRHPQAMITLIKVCYRNRCKSAKTNGARWDEQSTCKSLSLMPCFSRVVVYKCRVSFCDCGRLCSDATFFVCTFSNCCVVMYGNILYVSRQVHTSQGPGHLQ